MTVVLIKAQFRAGPGRAKVSGVVLAVMVAAATDARQIPVPVPVRNLRPQRRFSQHSLLTLPLENS